MLMDGMNYVILFIFVWNFVIETLPPIKATSKSLIECINIACAFIRIWLITFGALSAHM